MFRKKEIKSKYSPQEAAAIIAGPLEPKILKEIYRKLDWYINNHYSTAVLVNTYETMDEYRAIVIVNLLRKQGWNAKIENRCVVVELDNPINA